MLPSIQKKSFPCLKELLHLQCRISTLVYHNLSCIFLKQSFFPSLYFGWHLYCAIFSLDNDSLWTKIHVSQNRAHLFPVAFHSWSSCHIHFLKSFKIVLRPKPCKISIKTCIRKVKYVSMFRISLLNMRMKGCIKNLLLKLCLVSLIKGWCSALFHVSKIVLLAASLWNGKIKCQTSSVVSSAGQL